MSVLRTTVGDLPLEEYQLRLGERLFRILHTGAIISHDDEQRFLGAEVRLPYGIALWPSAIALAHGIAERDVANRRVLELGAGTGLPGIVAASLGAHVFQTDVNAVALAVCKLNAERNDVADVVHRAADWTAWQDDTPYDFILGADILYGESLHPHLRRIFEANLAPGGFLLLADPFRKTSFRLVEAMAADGWDVRVDKWTVAIVPPERSIGVFTLRR